MANIPLIHNYCDRWCEKCQFVDQCAVGVADSQFTKDQKDIDKEAFWTNLSTQFQNAISLLNKVIEDNGIVITEEDKLKFDKQRQNSKELVDAHPLTNMARKYAKEATLIDVVSLSTNFATNLESKVSLSVISVDEAKLLLEKVKDSVDTIHWFLYFIQVKLSRSLSTMNEFFDKQETQSDNNGSAKIACQAIEASIGAWHTIYNLMDDGDDKILMIMGDLSRLLRLTKEEFPLAMQFVRPGFDVGWEKVWSFDDED
jgi:hypothetical protein